MRDNIEWDDTVEVFSAIVTMSGTMVNCGDYVSYTDQDCEGQVSSSASLLANYELLFIALKSSNMVIWITLSRLKVELNIPLSEALKE